MFAAEGKVPADTGAIPAPIDRADGTIQRELKKRVSIDRRQSQIACKGSRVPARRICRCVYSNRQRAIGERQSTNSVHPDNPVW